MRRRRRPKAQALFACYQGTLTQAGILNKVELLCEFKAITPPAEVALFFFCRNDRRLVKYKISRPDEGTSSCHQSQPDNTPFDPHADARRAFAEKLAGAVAELEHRLQAHYERAHPAQTGLVRRAIAEAEAHAWDLSSFPHLFLPQLVEAPRGACGTEASVRAAPYTPAIAAGCVGSSFVKPQTIRH